MVKLKHHIFVCTSSRITGPQKGFCYQKDSLGIVQNFIEEVQERELEGEIMVTKTGCFALCEKGPIVVIYLEGIWYGSVSPDDVGEIMDALEEGETVNRLLI